MQYFDRKIKVLPCLIEGLNNDIASSSCDNTVTLDGPSSTCIQYYILDWNTYFTNNKIYQLLSSYVLIQTVHPKGNQFWILTGRTDAEAEYFGHLMQRSDSFKKTLMPGKIEVGGEGDNRGWDGWMASPTRWTWVWVSSGSWWWTGRPGMLQSMGSQTVRHNWATKLMYWSFCWVFYRHYQ